MSSANQVWVTLQRPGGEVTIPVPMNARGELPVLLINPVDANGRHVTGTWLAGRDDGDDLTTRYDLMTSRT